MDVDSEENESEDEEVEKEKEEEAKDDDEQEATSLDPTFLRESSLVRKSDGDTTVDSLEHNTPDNNHDQIAPSRTTVEPNPRDQSVHRASEDREEVDGDGSSASDEEDSREAGSDEEQQESPKKLNQNTSKAPPKRRLRSSRLLVPITLTGDGVDTDMVNLLYQLSDEQQLLKTSITAAEALSRLFEHGMHEPDGLQPDILDPQDYELIRHTFGEIEELNLNLTGTALTAPDDSGVEDDHLTKKLKRDHRRAKKQLVDISKEYRTFKKRMIAKQTAELETEAAQIKAGTHSGLRAELKAIEERRKARLCVLLAQKDYLCQMAENNYEAVHKAAHDQYQAGRVAMEKTMLDLVRSRMASLKQELLQSKKEAAQRKVLQEVDEKGRRLAYMSRNGMQSFAYDSCPESCSSYDSYSSSGSDCSDCETCRPERKPRRSALSSISGVTRRETAIDLGFLFPPPRVSLDHHHHVPRSASSGHGHGHEYGRVPGGGSTHRPGLVSRSITKGSPNPARNQQSLIDQMNDERRRKRRVFDREIQNHMSSKKQRANGIDATVDLDKEEDLDQDDSTAQSATSGPASHPHSPVQPRTGSPRLNLTPTSHRPRFVPGFGPDGAQIPKPVSSSIRGYRPLGPSYRPPSSGSGLGSGPTYRPTPGNLPGSGPAYRPGSRPAPISLSMYRPHGGARPPSGYPMVDRFGRSWNPTRPGMSSGSGSRPGAPTYPTMPAARPGPPEPHHHHGGGSRREQRPGLNTFRSGNAVTQPRRPPVEYRPHPILQELPRTNRGPRSQDAAHRPRQTLTAAPTAIVASPSGLRPNLGSGLFASPRQALGSLSAGADSVSASVSASSTDLNSGSPPDASKAT
ncbi:hypothetical protein BGZ83_007179 [Gryganskiella cystojenkinii]|nr:hypothetical protein BGZ83_007179 [Gryganskiella cystojenkinii]